MKPFQRTNLRASITIFPEVDPLQRYEHFGLKRIQRTVQ